MGKKKPLFTCEVIGPQRIINAIKISVHPFCLLKEVKNLTEETGVDLLYNLIFHCSFTVEPLVERLRSNCRISRNYCS